MRKLMGVPAEAGETMRVAQQIVTVLSRLQAPARFGLCATISIAASCAVSELEMSEEQFVDLCRGVFRKARQPNLTVV